MGVITDDVSRKVGASAGNRGKGRKKGVPNKTTLAMKEAISAVYAKLQDDAGDSHAHFHAWAQGNPTEFYKIAAKLIPTDINAKIDGQIGMPDITLVAPHD
jgi:hypothetical protein